MKIYAMLFILTCLAATAFAQRAKVNGTVLDTIGRNSLEHAVAYLKRVGDGRLVTYCRADQNGRFNMEAAAGEYIMVVQYPGYVDWMDSVRLVAAAPFNANVFMITQAHLLEEVIVKQTALPIRVKGDTTEFLADSFHVRPGATAEELLRAMPGFSVDARGKITAYGQNVQRVLVDGEEFFGNDPTFATQNINKSDIAKVQLYDKKSDKAVIIGMDDGVKERTVNFILKENAKKGYFGEVSGGGSFGDYYHAKATVSQFTPSRKMGILFIADRTGRGIDNGDFGYLENRGSGIPETLQASAMLNQKFGTGGNSTANNFTYNHFNLAGNSYTGIKYLLPDTSYYSNQYNTNSSSTAAYSLNSQNSFKMDSATTLTANTKLVHSDGSALVTGNGNVLADDGTMINANQRRNASSSANSSAKLDLFLKRQFNKTGTSFLTLGVGYSANKTNTTGLLYNRIDYYTGSSNAQQFIDQAKNNTSETNAWQLLASYVAPIAKKVSINLNYTFNTTQNEQNIATYEKRNGKYDSLNGLYSNHYQYTSVFHQGGASFTVNGKKTTLKTGIAIQQVLMKQEDFYTDAFSERSFVNVFPSAGFAWNASRTTTFNVNYNGRTQQPMLAQLQPLRNNEDPLNIQLGNPELRPAFSHLFNIDAANYRNVAGTFIRGGLGVTLAQDDISTASTIDNAGRRSFSAVNVDGNHSWNLWTSFGTNLPWFKMNTAMTPSYSNRYFTNFINGQRNSTAITGFSSTWYINKPFSEKSPLDVQFQYTYEFNKAVSSVHSALPSQFHIQYINLFLTYGPYKGWTISSSTLCQLREQLFPGDANKSSLLWTLTLEKRLMKQNNVSVVFRSNDILNQNIGFSRIINSTSVTENSYSTIRRYFLLSLRWKFNKDNKNTAN